MNKDVINQLEKSINSTFRYMDEKTFYQKMNNKNIIEKYFSDPEQSYEIFQYIKKVNSKLSLSCDFFSYVISFIISEKELYDKYSEFKNSLIDYSDFQKFVREMAKSENPVESLFAYNVILEFDGYIPDDNDLNEIKKNFLKVKNIISSLKIRSLTKNLINQLIDLIVKTKETLYFNFNINIEIEWLNPILSCLIIFNKLEELKGE